MSAAKLLPCPFCGGEARLHKPSGSTIKVVCPSCEASSCTYDDDESGLALAIDKWNAREEEIGATADEAEALLAALPPLPRYQDSHLTSGDHKKAEIIMARICAYLTRRAEARKGGGK